MRILISALVQFINRVFFDKLGGESTQGAE